MRFYQSMKTVSGSPVSGVNDERRRNVWNRLKVSGLIFLFYLILNIFHAGCPIKFITGVSCPGCGMTRAVLSALRLDFHMAFYYHPLFLLAPVMFVLFIFQDYVKPRISKVIWGIIILLFTITYLFRLFFVQNDVVSIDFNGGLVVKLLNQLFSIVEGFK